MQTEMLLHVFPQPPQLFLSFLKSTQTPSQSCVPSPHVIRQLPLSQWNPSPQSMPQPPQLAPSVR
jgi:hypothetical protein